MTAKRFGGVVGGATTAHSERVANAMGGNIRSASSVLGAPWRTARREKLLQRRVSIALGARSTVASLYEFEAPSRAGLKEFQSPPHSTHVNYTKHTMQSLSYVLALSEGMLDRLDLRVRRDRIAARPIFCAHSVRVLEPRLACREHQLLLRALLVDAREQFVLAHSPFRLPDGRPSALLRLETESSLKPTFALPPVGSRDQIFAADASFRVLSSRNERESRNMRSSKLFVTSSHGKLLNVSIQNHNRR